MKQFKIELHIQTEKNAADINKALEVIVNMIKSTGARVIYRDATMVE